MPETTLDIEGMTCASCVRRVEKALAKTEGVAEANVNFATHQATVVTADPVDARRLIESVEKAGYHAQVHSSQAKPDESLPSQKVNLAVAVSLTIPTVGLSMLWHPRPEAINWLLLGLATPVIFWCGRSFFMSAVKALRSGGTTMDTLVAMGSAAAWGYSLYALFAYAGHAHAQSEHIYFETGAVIVTLILLGRYLEARAKGRMSESIRKLMDLTPGTATLVTPEGERQVAAGELKVGDLVRVRPGERLAADGMVEEGESYVDESMISGEPMPVSKSPGDAVTGGTVNDQGTFVFRVERVGRATTLAQIARLVERAQGSRAPMQRLADRVSSIFVPIVIGLAVVTAAAWILSGSSRDAALMASVAVLVIACPCALGLATPTALMVGTGRGAELGILIKDGEALERAASVQTVLFDKTGTVTQGRPRLTGVDVFGAWERSEALSAAASLERPSEHPLARAVVGAAEEEGLEIGSVQSFEAVRGQGAVGRLGGEDAVIGKAGLAEERGFALDHDLMQAVRQREEEGRTVFVLAVGDRRAVISVSDEVAEHSGEAVRQLFDLGIASALVTGDNQATADAVGARVGIVQVHAQVRPEDKAQVVQEAQQTGPTAMVGDGINDAPALAQADVGIAMGTGTDIAIETAQVTLLRSDLRGVPQAIRLARRTLAIIRGNLFWAFAYNVVMIPLAAFGKLSPMLAAGAMAFSSISVILNSLRLRRFS